MLSFCIKKIKEFHISNSYRTDQSSENKPNEKKKKSDQDSMWISVN